MSPSNVRRITGAGECVVNLKKGPMGKNSKIFLKYVLRLIVVLPLALVLTPPAFAQSPPAIIGRLGYINGTPLSTHTSSSFNSSNASTLVAFVSTNTPWNGLPVSINGVSDNLGNNWTPLTGPTVFSGSTFTLLSA